MRPPLLVLILSTAACSASSSWTDAAVDHPRDRAVEARRDSARDAGPEAAASDRGPDRSGSDVRPDDGGVGDAKPTPATALYTVAASSSSFGLRTVATTSPGKVTQVTGWTGLVDLDALHLAGLQELVPVNADRPQEAKNQPADYQGIRLPGGLGHLYYFHRKLQGTSGLLQIKPDGSLAVLREVPGVYADTLADHVALEPSGKRGAAIVNPAGLFLFRTDGGTFGGGAPWKEVASAGLGLLSLRDASLTIAGDWIYVVGASSAGDLLLRAPLDGTADLTAVTLPPSGGATPVSIGDGIAVSSGRDRLAVAAGASVAQRDVYVVQASSGAAANATGSPALLRERGAVLGQLGGSLAISPGGVLVAYVAQLAGGEELFVARGDGSGTTLVTDDTRFKAEAGTLANLVFADDDDLVFMAGASSSQLDAFRWQHSTQQATNLTSGGKPPFSGLGAFSPQGGWLSPSGKWLYWIGWEFITETANVMGVSLTSFTVSKITTGAQVGTAAGALAACASSGTVYFSAKPNPKLYANELWSFDQELGKPATKLTSVSGPATGYWYLYDLTLSDDCSRLVWSAGGSYFLRDLWTLKSASGGARKVTPAPAYIGPSLRITPDLATVIYASGGSPTSTTLKAVAIAGGTPVTLDGTGGEVQVFAAY